MIRHRNLPAPPIRDVGELAAYAGEHLAYELMMFFEAAAELRVHRTRTDGSGTATTTTLLRTLGVTQQSLWFLQMARIEAFVTHYRNLVVFLFPDVYPVQPDDVCAHHFLSGSAPLTTWVEARGELSESLRAAKARADKELAHLTTERKPGGTASKDWPGGELARELAAILKTLVAVADAESLGGKVRSMIHRLGKLT